VVAQARRQPPDQGGEDRPVGPVQAWFWVGAAEHGDLVAQHHQLDVLGGRRSAEQQGQSQNLEKDQV
jgi:hypothetical protein